MSIRSPQHKPDEMIIRAADPVVAVGNDPRLLQMTKYALQLCGGNMIPLVSPSDQASFFAPVRLEIAGHLEQGALLLLQDRVLLAWYTGTIRRKHNTIVVSRVSIRKVGHITQTQTGSTQVYALRIRADQNWKIVFYPFGNSRGVAHILRGLLTGSLKPLFAGEQSEVSQQLFAGEEAEAGQRHTDTVPLVRVGSDPEGERICEQLRAGKIKCAIQEMPDPNSFGAIWAPAVRMILVNECDIDNARQVVETYRSTIGLKAHEVSVCESRPVGTDDPSGIGLGYEAVCECGWSGPLRETSDQAFGDARGHSPSVASAIVPAG